ncbi:predicted protein [Lichtheimia corymbifera JMRC:FSU:9682]|uniref:Uncharacterized protein n=1 Tax=Lichtheimia corymbifera JMRC:FSU:9682 TaxID=1263082 RepID=A0A068SC01_9FUNG|nr:predicted protein [Lichtheimia corymbifera JMRC:FSU:9682]
MDGFDIYNTAPSSIHGRQLLSPGAHAMANKMGCFILSPISHWNAFFYLGDASHFGKGWHNPLLVVQMKATMQYRFHLVIFWLADGISIPMQCRRLICKTQEGIP